MALLDPRRGGRGARLASRAAPLSDNLRPVWPGMKGGRYRPLDASDVTRIHQAALDVLEGIGMADAPPSGVELLTAAGAKLGREWPDHVSALGRRGHDRRAGRRFVLHGLDPRHDLEPWASASTSARPARRYTWWTPTPATTGS